MKKYRLEEQLRFEDINRLIVRSKISRALHIVELVALTLIILKLTGVFS